MADEPINPEVKKTLGDMSGERIDARAAGDFPRHFWSTSKHGHYRFALAGVAIAVPIAAAIGAAVAAAVSWALAPIIIPAFIGAGALMAVESFGSTGSAAASRASGLAEKHARILDGEGKGLAPQTALDDNLMNNGQGHHYEFPRNRDNGKLFSWKSGLTGAAMGAAAGGLLGIGGAIAHIPAAAAIATAIPALAVAPFLPIVVAGAITFGLFGLTFGIERKVFKSIFNYTDAHIQGKLSPDKSPDLGKQQSQESDPALAQQRVQRQADIDRLERSYNERISWGALSGRFRGFLGTVPGVAIGAVVGVLALAAVSLTGGAALLPMIAHSVVVPLFAAAGGLLGMKVFSEAGMEAGAEATARSIDNEFERNRALRAQGITPPKPKETKGSWLNPKAALIMGVIGAAVGAALTLAMAPGILALLPVAVAAHIGTGALIGISAIIGGGVGASYGLGDKSLKAVAKPFTRIYDKVVFGQNPVADPGQQVTAQLPVPVQAPLYDKVTAEDARLLDDRLSAGTGKSFTQVTQQMRDATQTITVRA